MWRRIFEILRKEFRQTLREPRMRAMLVVPPMVQLLVFGYAVNLDVDQVRIAWMDGDRTPYSRELISAFTGSGRFVVLAEPTNEQEIQRLLDHGDVDGVLRVLPRFEADLKRGQPAEVQVLVDGSNSNTARLVSSYSSEVLAAFSSRIGREQQNARILLRSASAPANTTAPEIDVRTRVWFNPDLRSRNYFIPGVIVNIIMIITHMLTALGIVREKEIGTMEQLMVTPIRPIELMLGKLLPFALVGLVQVVLITSIALAVFRIPFRGSALMLFFSAALFLLNTLGIGLFVSTISKTQQQAIMSSFFFTIPAFMLSGFAFPIANMPLAVQFLTYLNPARYFMEIVRGVFLKGTGVAILWPQMVGLAVFGTGIMVLSASRFQKKLD